MLSPVHILSWIYFFSDVIQGRRHWSIEHPLGTSQSIKSVAVFSRRSVVYCGVKCGIAWCVTQREKLSHLACPWLSHSGPSGELNCFTRCEGQWVRCFRWCVYHPFNSRPVPEFSDVQLAVRLNFSNENQTLFVDFPSPRTL